MIFLTQEFSLHMISDAVLRTKCGNLLRIYKISTHTAGLILSGDYPDALDVPMQSFIGHPEIAWLAAADVAQPPFPVNRQNLVLGLDDWLVVAQYKGPVLEPDTTVLPENAKIEWWLIKYADPGILE